MHIEHYERRELFRGDFRAVRQQTAVFFADTHTQHTLYIIIYRRTQTLNPSLRIGAPGKNKRLQEHVM